MKMKNVYFIRGSPLMKFILFTSLIFTRNEYPLFVSWIVHCYFIDQLMRIWYFIHEGLEGV